MNILLRQHRKRLLLLLLVISIILAIGGGLFFSRRALSPSHPTTTAQQAPILVALPGAKPFAALREDYAKPSSLWMLVNKTHPMPLDYTPSSLVLPSVATRSDKSVEERSIRTDIEPALIALFAAAKADNHDLMIGSAYRSANLQKMYFDHYAEVAGEAAANRYSAHPGESEHQTGLSVDLTSVSLTCYLDECFADTADGKWLADNAYKYGFILRYPKGKETVTGYQFEPWHYRYVGADLATALYESNLTLDEARPQLEAALRELK